MSEAPKLPLVALHGWALNLRVFDGVFDSLDRTVHCLDLPGHGRAVEPESLQRNRWQIEVVARELLERMPPRAIVLGWSLGGTLALQMAAQAPQRIAAMVLVSATPRFARAVDWLHGADPAVLSGFVTHLEADYRHTVHDFLELQVRGSAAATDTLSKLRDVLVTQGECTADVLHRAIAMLHRSDLRGALPAIQQPSLVVSGQYDRIVHPAASRALAELLPNGHYVELNRCGHAPFLSHRDEFIAAVTSFLRDAS